MQEDTDLYGDTGQPADVPAQEEAGSETYEGPQTALLPKSFFPDEPSPGKVCRIAVEQVLEDQVSVRYEKSEEGTGEQPAVAEAPRDEELSGYMS